jgi:hypothetical protein
MRKVLLSSLKGATLVIWLALVTLYGVKTTNAMVIGPTCADDGCKPCHTCCGCAYLPNGSFCNTEC